MTKRGPGLITFLPDPSHECNVLQDFCSSKLHLTNNPCVCVFPEVTRSPIQVQFSFVQKETGIGFKSHGRQNEC